MWENQDSAQANGIDSVLSKAEIASCSYEARYVEIKSIVILTDSSSFLQTLLKWIQTCQSSLYYMLWKEIFQGLVPSVPFFLSQMLDNFK